MGGLSRVGIRDDASIVVATALMTGISYDLSRS